jgi:hypothetical protein
MRKCWSKRALLIKWNNHHTCAKMDIQKIVIFALIGAVMLFVVTGGAVSMMGEEGASPVQLGGGALTGGVLGAAAAYFMGEDLPALPKMMGGGDPQMKVGLPGF